MYKISLTHRRYRQQVPHGCKLIYNPFKKSKLGIGKNDSHGVDFKFNTFQNIFLRTSEASFPTVTQKWYLKVMNR
jgi:hypothetical protein